MKTVDVLAYMHEQKDRHAKTTFTVAELANVAGAAAPALNVQLTRMRKQGLVERVAHGRYSLPGQSDLGALVQSIDRAAYITGAAALHAHGLVTQAPTQLDCFTNRRHNRSRRRRTVHGTLVFVCVTGRIHAPPAQGVYAPAEQALLDFVYLARRQGADPAAMVTLRGLEKLDRAQIGSVGERYPRSVRNRLTRMLA
jgi:hypothetical protein